MMTFSPRSFAVRAYGSSPLAAGARRRCRVPRGSRTRRAARAAGSRIGPVRGRAHDEPDKRWRARGHGATLAPIGSASVYCFYRRDSVLPQDLARAQAAPAGRLRWAVEAEHCFYVQTTGDLDKLTNRYCAGCWPRPSTPRASPAPASSGLRLRSWRSARDQASRRRGPRPPGASATSTAWTRSSGWSAAAASASASPWTTSSLPAWPKPARPDDRDRLPGPADHVREPA